jgi:hypothetical protein
MGLDHEEKELCETLQISEERKREIDEILKETHRKLMNGEIETISLEEFLEKRKEEMKNTIKGRRKNEIL